LGRCLVAKPAADTAAGAGVSTNLNSVGLLRHAAAWARAFGPGILVEKQVEGDCYRVLLMDHEVLDVVMRRPPTVVGDGTSTVHRLIARENELRLRMGTERAHTVIRRDPDLVNTLASQNLDLRTRPARGRPVVLKRVINENRAKENEAANDRLCPAILEATRRASMALGLRLAGVDVICRNPHLALERSGGVVIDVNTTPGLYIHHHRAGTGFPAAERILQRFFAAGPP
jgi:cyanophycin synthetase